MRLSQPIFASACIGKGKACLFEEALWVYALQRISRNSGWFITLSGFRKHRHWNRSFGEVSGNHPRRVRFFDFFLHVVQSQKEVHIR